MSSSLSPTSSSSTSCSSTSAYAPQSSSSSSSTSSCSTTSLHSSLGGCCSLPRFPAGMGLSMMHSHDFCSPYSPTPTAGATCPVIGFGHHFNPQSSMSMMQEAASCTSHSTPTSHHSTPLSLCSSSVSSPAYHHQHPTSLVPWLSNHQASLPHHMFAVSPVSSMTSPPAACSPMHPSKNGTISLATVSVPLSFYLGGDGSGRVMTAPSHASSHLPSGLSAAYSAFSASPVHMDVSLGFLRGQTRTHKTLAIFRPSPKSFYFFLFFSFFFLLNVIYFL